MINNKHFIIVYDTGTCGSFLAGLAASYFYQQQFPKISTEKGHCHNWGKGDWVDSNAVTSIGKTPEGYPWILSHDLSYTIEFPHTYISKTHIPYIDELKQKVLDAKIILIDFELNEIETIITFMLNKVWITLWTQEEYNRLAGPDWPPYHVDNLKNDSFIINELREKHKPSLLKWHKIVDRQQCDYVINFKTILGLDSIDLNQQVADIFNKPVNSDYQVYIDEYRAINKKLYSI